MSRKRAPAREKPQEAAPIELASLVSERVQIRNILLASSKSYRTPSAMLKESDQRIECRVVEVEYGVDRDSKRITVLPSFALSINHGEAESEDRGEEISIEATFALIYSVRSLDSLSEQNFAAFASVNGVFNAWPYWREFVQNTAARMGFSGLAIPVYMLGQSED
jgi:hypothetical protein